MPFFFGHTLLVGWNVVEYLLEASGLTLGESESHGDCVEDSSQDFLLRGPTYVSFHKLAYRDGFTLCCMIDRVQRTEHVVLNCHLGEKSSEIQLIMAFLTRNRRNFRLNCQFSTFHVTIRLYK